MCLLCPQFLICLLHHLQSNLRLFLLNSVKTIFMSKRSRNLGSDKNSSLFLPLCLFNICLLHHLPSNLILFLLNSVKTIFINKRGTNLGYITKILLTCLLVQHLSPPPSPVQSQTLPLELCKKYFNQGKKEINLNLSHLFSVSSSSVSSTISSPFSATSSSSL